MDKTKLGFAVVIACGLLMMPLLVDVDQRQTDKAATSAQAPAHAELASLR
jgi:hypothetical protein